MFAESQMWLCDENSISDHTVQHTSGALSSLLSILPSNGLSIYLS